MNKAALQGGEQVGGKKMFFQLGALFFILLVGLASYTFAHEGGHALVGLLFGGRINGFSINFLDLSAHVGIDGEFARWQQALISVAGVSVPVIACLALLVFLRKQDEMVLFLFKSILALIAFNGLLAWIVIPILALSGQTVGDDSFNFLSYTRISPLVESAGALLAYVLSWIAFFRLVGGARAWVSRFRRYSIDPERPETRRSLLSIGLVGVVVLAMAVGLSLGYPDTRFSAPAGYEQVAELDLSQGGLSEQSVYQFRLEAPARVGFAVFINDVQGAPVKLRLIGPGDAEKVFLNMDDPQTRIGRASVTPPVELMAAGEYEIVVSFPQCAGKVKVYFQMKDEG